MVLSDVDIKRRVSDGSIVIEPFDEEKVEPSSVDLHLGSEFKKVTRKTDFHVVDTSIPDDNTLEYETVSDVLVINPGEFVLATTKESISLSDEVSANVLGRSSLGRIGISVHQTAGYIDPGFSGEITLELSNHGPAPVRLYAGDRICQIVFHELSSRAERPYGHKGSQYQGQRGATPSGMKFD